MGGLDLLKINAAEYEQLLKYQMQDGKRRLTNDLLKLFLTLQVSFANVPISELLQEVPLHEVFQEEAPQLSGDH